MAQWHTWGVIWSPTTITYTLDGVVWGSVSQTSAIPNQPMTLDLQQQTWCGSSPAWACPSANESTIVDWVAEYSPRSNSSPTTTSTTTTTTSTPVESAKNAASATSVALRPFAQNSWNLSSKLKQQIANLAKTIRSDNASLVALVGFSDSGSSHAGSLAISRDRAVVVKNYLASVLRALNYRGVTIQAIGEGVADPVASNATATGRALNRRVVASIR
jgi:outer membrane protein OmpA-like peptidoglycan-associated protein